MTSSKQTIIFLMGPTASGKTDLAVRLVQTFPCEIISVDSAMVYRGMDIGTAKPNAEVLRIAPHRLIDKVDPGEPYSAGQFRTDALREIEDIMAKGKTPLLVGGTMLYFRVLQQGIASLPKADVALRAELQSRAEREGWEALHAYLESVDPSSATRIKPRDGQRIQRALEVYLITGKTMTAWQAEDTHPASDYAIHPMALIPSDRSALHQRIAARFDQMLALGVVNEVKALVDRGDLTTDLPSMRSVGYREIWAYLNNTLSYDAMRERAIIATRQLAKRQMTWLNSWPGVTRFEAEDKQLFSNTAKWLEEHLSSSFSRNGR